MSVIIGIDPHKLLHAACVIDRTEVELAELQVRTGPRQLAELLSWAAPFSFAGARSSPRPRQRRTDPSERTRRTTFGHRNAPPVTGRARGAPGLIVAHARYPRGYR